MQRWEYTAGKNLKNIQTGLCLSSPTATAENMASGRDLVSSSSTDVEMEDKNTAQESKRQRRSVANEKDGAEKQQRAVDKLLRMVLNDMST